MNGGPIAYLSRAEIDAVLAAPGDRQLTCRHDCHRCNSHRRLALGRSTFDLAADFTQAEPTGTLRDLVQPTCAC